MKQIIIIIALLIGGYVLISNDAAEKTLANEEKQDKNILKDEQKRMEDMKNMDKVLQQNVTDRMESVDK